MKNNDAIKTVIALALTDAVLFSQADTDMTVCADGDDACQTVTAEDYQALKVDLADKLSNDTPLTIEEWQVLVVDYMKVSVILTGAIQDLDARLQKLEVRK